MFYVDRFVTFVYQINMLKQYLVRENSGKRYSIYVLQCLLNRLTKTIWGCLFMFREQMYILEKH